MSIDAFADVMEELVTIKVLFFATARDLAGFSSNQYTLPSRTSTIGIIEEISKVSPGILKIKDTLIVSVNQEYCEANQSITLSPGDEVAIIPPISGVRVKEEQKESDVLGTNVQIKSEPVSDEELSCDCPFSFWGECDDLKLVQINKSREEIDRRIKAFQQLKREEINAQNVFEFCQTKGVDIEDSCARTNAAFSKPKGDKSHLKYTKVNNDWGPLSDINRSEENRNKFQNELSSPTSHSLDSSKRQSHSTVEGVEERLTTIEQHLNCQKGRKDGKSLLFSRIKVLEDRILYLEALSPEYFGGKATSSADSPSKIKKERTSEDDMTLDEIDAKIFTLRKKMKSKQIGLDL